MEEVLYFCLNFSLLLFYPMVMMCILKSLVHLPLCLVVATVFYHCCPLQSSAQTPDQLPETSKVRRFTLPNGMRCFIAYNPKPERRAEIRLFVNVGSLVEDDDQQGLAHVLEHLAFNGSKRFPGQSVVKYLESRGMDFGAHTNALTTADETVYQMQIPTDSLSVVATAFDIVADWASALTLDSASIENERKIVIEEWRLRSLGVQGRVNTAFFTSIWGQTRYEARQPIGTKSSLDTFRHEALRRFYRDWYVPENMALVVVGDIPLDTLEKHIRQHLSNVPTGTPLRNVVQERAQMRLLPLDTAAQAEIPHVALLFDKELPNYLCATSWRNAHQPNINRKAYRANMLKNMTLMLVNNRLQDRIATSAKPPFRNATVALEESNRVLAVTTLLIEPSDALFTSYQAALEELHRIRQDGFLPSEISRVRRSLLKGISTNFNERENMTSRTIVEACLNHLRTGAAIVLPEDVSAFDSAIVNGVRSEELRQTAQQLFPLGTSGQSTFIASPLQDSAGINRDAVFALLQRAASTRLPAYTEDTTSKPLLRTVPQGGRILRERTYSRVGVTEWRLSNGLRVLLKPTNFKNDEILLYSFMQGGLSLASEEDYQAILRTAKLQHPAVSGIGELTPAEYTKMLADKVVSLSPYIDGLYHGISASSSAGDLETMMRVLYAAHTAPRIDSGNIHTAKEAEKQAFGLRWNFPLTKFQDTIGAVLYNNHYTVRSVTKSELERWNHAEVGFPFYKQLFRNVRGGVIVFVGSFDVQRIKPLILRYCGALPSRVTSQTFRDIAPKPFRGRYDVAVHSGKDNQAATNIFLNDTVSSWSLQKDIAFSLAAVVADTKLRETLRNEARGVYTSSVSISYTSQPVARLSANVAFSSEPERAQELYELMNNLWKRLAEDGMTQDDIEEARTKLLKEREVSMKNNGAWLSRLVLWAQNGESPERITEYEGAIRSLTLAEVREALRKALLAPHHARFILLPEEAVKSK